MPSLHLHYFCRKFLIFLVQCLIDLLSSLIERFFAFRYTSTLLISFLKFSNCSILFTISFLSFPPYPLLFLSEPDLSLWEFHPVVSFYEGLHWAVYHLAFLADSLLVLLSSWQLLMHSYHWLGDHCSDPKATPDCTCPWILEFCYPNCFPNVGHELVIVPVAIPLMFHDFPGLFRIEGI